MDERRLDGLVRRLGARTDRRTVLRGAIVAGAAIGFGRTDRANALFQKDVALNIVNNTPSEFSVVYWGAESSYGPYGVPSGSMNSFQCDTYQLTAYVYLPECEPGCAISEYQAYFLNPEFSQCSAKIIGRSQYADATSEIPTTFMEEGTVLYGDTTTVERLPDTDFKWFTWTVF